MTLTLSIRSTISDFSQMLVTLRSRGSAESRLVTNGDTGDGYHQGPEAAVGALVTASYISRRSQGDQCIAVTFVSAYGISSIHQLLE